MYKKRKRGLKDLVLISLRFSELIMSSFSLHLVCKTKETCKEIEGQASEQIFIQKGYGS